MLATAGIGLLFVMAYVWKGLVIESEIPSVVFRFVIGASFWTGMGGFLLVPVAGVASVIFRQLVSIEPSLAIRLVSEYIDSPRGLGVWFKWYLVAVGVFVPFLLALQAFGLLGGPWVPSMSKDWFWMVLYVVSQLPMVLGALISLQFPWIYGVRIDDGCIRYNFLWIDRKMNEEDIVYSATYELLVILLSKQGRIPLLVPANPPDDTE